MFWKSKDWPWLFTNAVEAAYFTQILDEEEIPYTFVRHGEALWAFSEQVSEGYGHVETLAEFRDRVDTLYREFLTSEPPESEDVPEDIHDPEAKL